MARKPRKKQKKTKAKKINFNGHYGLAYDLMMEKGGCPYDHEDCKLIDKKGVCQLSKHAEFIFSGYPPRMAKCRKHFITMHKELAQCTPKETIKEITEHLKENKDKLQASLYTTDECNYKRVKP